MSRRYNTRAASGSRRTREEEEEEQNAVVRTPEVFSALPHFEPVWVDYGFLINSGISNRVIELLTRSGWPSLLTLQSVADIEDTCEFLGTFRYENFQRFHYTHRGVRYTCSMQQLRSIFGWPDGGEILIVHMGNELELWRNLTEDNSTYYPSQSIARRIAEPAFFYLQFILSRTLFARKNGVEKITRQELGVLNMLRRGEVINWGHYLCCHLRVVRIDGPVTCGGMITYMLRRLHPLPVPADHRILQCSYADRVRFQSGRNIRVSSTGEYQWIYHAKEERRPAVSPPRPRGRPPGRGRGRQVRGRALVIAEPTEQQQDDPPTQQYQQSPHDHQTTQEQVDYMFNMTRALYLAMQGGFQSVPAPPGWRPGDAIPPEYMQPQPPPEDH